MGILTMNWTMLKKYKHNILFYLLIVIIAYFNCWLFLHSIHTKIEDGFMIYFWSQFYQIATCVIITSPYFLIKNNKWIIFIILFLFDIYILSNMLYYRTYYNIMPLQSFAQISNLEGLGPSILASFRFLDLLFVLPSIILILFYVFFIRKKIQPENIRMRIVLSFCIFLFIFSSISFNILRYYMRYRSISNKFSIFFVDQCAGTKYYGFIACWIWQIRDVWGSNAQIEQVEKDEIEKWLENQLTNNNSKRLDDIENKNLILIFVESLESWPIGFYVDSVEVTPRLNEVLINHNNIYAPWVLVQTKAGRSSDAQFIVNTGLLPISSGSVFFRFTNNKYNTISKALKQKIYYSTKTMIGDDPSFWNQGAMNPSLGFDKLISSLNYDMSDQLGMGLSDESFFKQSVEIIKNIPQPFYVQLITLSSHFPFKLPQEKIEIHFPNDFPTEVADYLQSINYVDKAIGNFINDLKINGLFEKSIIIITGDHEGLGRDVRDKYLNDKYLKGKMTDIFYVPLLIINSPIRMKYEGVIGQIDIYPTILDLFGLKDYKWRGLGNSIFRIDRDDFAVDSKLEVIGDTIQVTMNKIQHVISEWQISDLIISKNYFEKDN